MTVFGGLQFLRGRYKFGRPAGFNTDDGIWRATIGAATVATTIRNGVSIPMTVFGGLQLGNPPFAYLAVVLFQYR